MPHERLCQRLDEVVIFHFTVRACHFLTEITKEPDVVTFAVACIVGVSVVVIVVSLIIIVAVFITVVEDVFGGTQNTAEAILLGTLTAVLTFFHVSRGWQHGEDRQLALLAQ